MGMPCSYGWLQHRTKRRYACLQSLVAVDRFVSVPACPEMGIGHLVGIHLTIYHHLDDGRFSAGKSSLHGRSDLFSGFTEFAMSAHGSGHVIQTHEGVIDLEGASAD